VKSQLLIAAAGLGERMGEGRPKALMPLAGVPILARTLERFRGAGLVEGAVIVVPSHHRVEFADTLAAIFPDMTFRLEEGGRHRQLSVANGLAALDTDTEIVVIHDAARPYVTAACIDASIETAAACGAATVAVPATDTILAADEEGFVVDTPDRSALWACQTPQTFRVAVIREAHARAREDGFMATDDATLVRRYDGKVRIVLGTPLNFKITTPADLALAECVYKRKLA